MFDKKKRTVLCENATAERELTPEEQLRDDVIKPGFGRPTVTGTLVFIENDGYYIEENGTGRVWRIRDRDARDAYDCAKRLESILSGTNQNPALRLAGLPEIKVVRNN